MPRAGVPLAPPLHATASTLVKLQTVVDYNSVVKCPPPNWKVWVFDPQTLSELL